MKLYCVGFADVSPAEDGYVEIILMAEDTTAAMSEAQAIMDAQPKIDPEGHGMSLCQSPAAAALPKEELEAFARMNSPREWVVRAAEEIKHAVFPGITTREIRAHKERVYIEKRAEHAGPSSEQLAEIERACREQEAVGRV